MPTLPTRAEAHGLHRLRTLRVGRAREGVAVALRGVEAAQAAIAERQRKIARGRRAIETLDAAVVGHFAAQLPRWSDIAVAQRELLAETLERDETELVDDEETLERAQETLQKARAELTRALAREDAVAGLVQETRRAHLAGRERRAERELEDQGPARRPMR